LQFISQAEGLNIGTIINKKLLASSTIFQLLLDTDSSTSKCLALADAEVAELEVRPGSKITEAAVKDLKLPRSLTLAGLIRNGRGQLITGATVIEPGDHVLVFCLLGSLHKVETPLHITTLIVKSLLNRPLINIHALLRVIGLLLTIEAAFMLFPIIACLIYGESDWLPFTCTCAGTGLIGAWLYFCIKPSHATMGKRDGFLLTASVWAVFSLFGMIPFIFSSCPLSPSDAYFEAMSGFTTTGASVIPRMEDASHGILLWRSIMQWIGGMGIILFTLAVIPMLNHSGAVQMFNAEVTGITHDKLRPRVSQTAKSLWLIYIALTIIMVGLLWAGPMNFFESLCHSLSTISTGGFSTRSDSIAAWDSLYVKIVVLVFMFLGGVNFALIYKAISGEFRQLWKNDVLRTYCFVVLLAWALFMLSMICHGTYTDIENLVVDSIFQVVSTITSSGFTVCNFEAWGYFVIAIIFLLMFTGSCAGSTSGGSKLDRCLYLVKNSYNELYRCIHPNAITVSAHQWPRCQRRPCQQGYRVPLYIHHADCRRQFDTDRIRCAY